MIQNTDAEIHLACQEGENILSAAGIPGAKQETHDLWDWAKKEANTLDGQLAVFQSALQKRTQRTPFAYIVGTQPFYHRLFHVTPAVLIPRPETEFLVEHIVRRSDPGQARMTGDPIHIVDCGTGSGAIAITLAKELPNVHVMASDINEAALSIARQNADALEASVDVRHGHLLEPFQGEPVDAVIANLPYLPESWKEFVQPELQHEPVDALYAGDDGLDVVYQFLDQLSDGIVKPSIVWLELLPDQVPVVENNILALLPNARCSILPDRSGISRFLQVEWKRIYA